MIKAKRWSLNNFELAFAYTTHKSQSDTIKDVNIVIHDKDDMLRNKKLCYTAMTRATKASQLYLYYGVDKKNNIIYSSDSDPDSEEVELSAEELSSGWS